jgi:hypothetical protein
MRISNVLVSAILLATVIIGNGQMAQAADQAMCTNAVAQEDYDMYVKGSGLPNSDELFAKYNTERKAYLAGKTTQAVTPTSNDEAMKIASYKENDYSLYVKATGGTSNDEVHIRFNTERNAFLGKVLETVKPAVTTSNEDMKIQSFKENDYLLYVKATGGVSNDEVHVRFNTERNAYLGNTTPTPPTVEPTVQTKPAVKPNKPSRRVMVKPVRNTEDRMNRPSGRGKIKMIKIIYFN